MNTGVKVVLFAAAGLAGMCLVLGIIGALFGSGTNNIQSVAAASSAPTSTAPPPETTSTTAAPTTSTTAAPTTTEAAPPPPPETTSTTAAPTTTTTAAPLPSLGYDTATFVQRWNSTIASVDGASAWRIIDSPTIQPGSVQDVWQVNLTSFATLQGTVRKDSGNVREIVLLTASDGISDSADVLLMFGLLVSTVSPELAPEERGDILTRFAQDDFGSGDEGTSVVRGAVKFHVTSSPELGIWFIASSALE